jgi:hypothetical protein
VRNGNRWRVIGVDAQRDRIAAERITDNAGSRQSTGDAQFTAHGDHGVVGIDHPPDDAAVLPLQPANPPIGHRGPAQTPPRHPNRLARLEAPKEACRIHHETLLRPGRVRKHPPRVTVVRRRPFPLQQPLICAGHLAQS